MIQESDISYPALLALRKLHENNKEAYIVGGAVRDILMHKKPHDFDIAASSTPEETLKIFSEFKTYETGIKFGTVTVIIENTPIEITTFRTDGKYLNNRQPEKIKFSKNLKDDLLRRDFTINALCYSPKSGLIDLFGGKKDIEDKIIRTVGDPDKRFNEDALRILRALRFSSALSFSIEDSTKKAIYKNKNLLLNISSERIREEFNRILSGENADGVLSLYRDIIAVFIPEIIPCFDFEQKNPHHVYDLYTHMLKALKASENDLTVRLAVFFHDIAKPICFTCDQNRIRHYKNHAELGAKLAEDILKRLKYSSKTIKNVSALIKYHDTDIAPEKPEVKKYLNLLGKELLKKLFSVKTADCLAKPGASEKWYDDTVSAKQLMEKIIKENECCCLKDLELKGDDLLKAGIKEKNIGKILNEVLNEVIYERLENKKSVLLKYALSYAERINS